ncbi:hypothetical protein, partial [Peribacillus frigoritolerans]|uniref:hypothetical protein n=1 Tax=Peribacillus frigoritolerans TaxID=450367 RepID=UPI002E1C8102|nr:hypothetical protein [Peribacillus frigoritolerans]
SGCSRLLLRKARLGETPQAKAEEAHLVPGVEIKIQIVQAIKIDKLDLHRVCLQSEASLLS